MTSAAQSADWFADERRKQNYAIAAIVIACLIFALFPRNERRLFTFPGAEFFTVAISPPVQTRLRSGIFSPIATTAQPKPATEEPVIALPPVVEDIDIFGDSVMPEWSFIDEPIQFDRPQLSGLSEITRRSWMGDTPMRSFPQGGRFFFAGGVPEPSTWLMMILGAAAIAYRLRADHARRLSRRGRARWRRKLVPSS